jgi:hypothetical protein
MAREPRKSERVSAEVAVRLENRASGLTRDISPNGVYFVIGQSLESGQVIRFTLEFEDRAGGMLHLNCTGEVVRVEEAGGSAAWPSRSSTRSSSAARRAKAPMSTS